MAEQNLRLEWRTPDDFQLTGSYAKQLARFGNSVPLLMTRAIAEMVRDVIFGKGGATPTPALCNA